MFRHTYYDSPLGKIFLLAEDENIVGLWFVGQKYDRYHYEKIKSIEAPQDPSLQLGIQWLDAYFNGHNPSLSSLLLAPRGTPFFQEVWQILMQIPYGSITTYGDIAHAIAKKHNLSSMSSQAIGQAVGHNPISIMIPCHRVIAKNGNLTGYAAGIERKKALLFLEGAYHEKTCN